jgi:hypothetical protein
MLRASPEKVIAYLKTLSPSGTELEIMAITTFDFKEGAEDENLVSKIGQTNLCFVIDGYIPWSIESSH